MFGGNLSIISKPSGSKDTVQFRRIKNIH